MRALMGTLRFATLAVLLVFALNAQAVPSIAVNDAGDSGPGNCASTCTLRSRCRAPCCTASSSAARGLWYEHEHVMSIPSRARICMPISAMRR